MITPAAQLVTHGSFMSDWFYFRNGLSDASHIQAKILDNILLSHPYLKDKKDFLKSPINDYSSQILKLSAQKNILRYQPTSGSGDVEKLIPYTKKFIRELNCALHPWLFQTALKNPGILSGKHYWSISWLPTQWREKGWFLDDFDLLPPWKKNLTRKLLAVPHEVARANTLPSSQFATLAYLVASADLTFISVWSPTFFLQLLNLLEFWREPLAKTLFTGRWERFQEELKFLKAPQQKEQARKILLKNISLLWPGMKLVSAWDSSSSASWAQILHSHFPQASFQGKGLWATEGVVTIPFEGEHVLSYRSHYYEFLETKTGSLLSSHELKEGQEVQPLLTSSNGFTRYNLKDRLIVTGKKGQAPTLKFLERVQTLDLVGEKLDTKTFLHIHDVVKTNFPHLSWVVALGINTKTQTPHYIFTIIWPKKLGNWVRKES
jgi:hypothetical protein